RISPSGIFLLQPGHGLRPVVAKEKPGAGPGFFNSVEASFSFRGRLLAFGGLLGWRRLTFGRLLRLRADNGFDMRAHGLRQIAADAALPDGRGLQRLATDDLAVGQQLLAGFSVVEGGDLE